MALTTNIKEATALDDIPDLLFFVHVPVERNTWSVFEPRVPRESIIEGKKRTPERRL